MANFYTQIFVRDGLAMDFGLCRIWRDHGRDFSWVTSGSRRDWPRSRKIPSFYPAGITVNPVGIGVGSQRDPVGISPGSRKIPSFYPAGIPVNPDGIPVNPDGIPVNPDGIPTISRSNPTKSRLNPVGIWAGSGSRVFIPVDPTGIPSGIPVGSHRDSHPFFHLGSIHKGQSVEMKHDTT